MMGNVVESRLYSNSLSGGGIEAVALRVWQRLINL